MKLIAKIDETNTHGAPFMMMAGYMARVSAWEKFDRLWSRGLKRAGLDYWHGVETATHPFALDAHEISDSNLLFGFVVRMNKTDFAIYRAGAWGGKAQPDSMYGLCFRYCLSFVVQRAVAELPRRSLTVDFVIEKGGPNSGAPATILEELRSKKVPDFSEFLGTVTLEDKKLVPGLPGGRRHRLRRAANGGEPIPGTRAPKQLDCARGHTGPVAPP